MTDYTPQQLQLIAGYLGWRELVHLRGEWLAGEHKYPHGKYKEFRTLSDADLFAVLDDKAVSHLLPCLSTKFEGARIYTLSDEYGPDIDAQFIGEGPTRLSAAITAVLKMLEART